MFPLSADVLSLTDEAALAAQKGTVQFANARALELLGSGCVGRSVAEVFGPEIAGAQAPSFAADVSLSCGRQLVRMTRMDGVQLFFLSRPEPMPALLSDAFLYAMRTSLANLNLATEQLRARLDVEADPALVSSFAAVNKSYFTFARLLSNASNAYAIFRHELAVKPMAVDLAALCDELVATLQKISPAVEYRIRIDGRPVLWADPELLHALLLNLVSNSLRHAEGLTAVSLGVLCTNEHAVLSVSDDGCGIPPERLHAIFSRYRYGFGMSDLSAGAGLGLTVARGVTEAHGGTLLLESREGHGTTVRASLDRRARKDILYNPEQTYHTGMRELLTGLADALPQECFTERYLD